MHLSMILIAASLGQVADSTNVHRHEIKTTYDRVADYSTLRATLGQVFERPESNVKSSLIFYYVWKGQDRERIGIYDKVRFQLITSAEDWEFLDSHAVSILAGSHRMHPESERKGTVHAGYIIESVYCNLTREEVEQIGASDSVEAKVGLQGFSLSPSQIAAIKDFASRLAVSTKEADRIAAEHDLLVRRRAMELRAAAEEAVEEARKAVKSLPKKRRAAQANEVGMKKLKEVFRPTGLKYHVTWGEFLETVKDFPEFANGLPTVEPQK